jgi:hypothetical protein
VRLPIREVLGIIPDNLHSLKVYANSTYLSPRALVTRRARRSVIHRSLYDAALAL